MKRETLTSSEGNGRITISYAVKANSRATVFQLSVALNPEWETMAMGVDYHEPGDSNDVCRFIGQACNCDGSMLQGKDAFKILRAGGSDALFDWLETKHEEYFGVLNV